MFLHLFQLINLKTQILNYTFHIYYIFNNLTKVEDALLLLNIY